MYYIFFFQAEDGIRDLVRSRGLGDVYKRQDPTKVTRVALENAASIAGMVLTTECVINDKKEKEDAHPPHMGGGGMGGMM